MLQTQMLPIHLTRWNQSCIQEPRLKNKIWIAIWLKQKTKEKILGQPSERPIKVTLVPFSYVPPPGNAPKSLSPAPRPTPYFHWMEVMSQNKWDCRRHSLHGYGTGVSSRLYILEPGPQLVLNETELKGSVLGEDCPRTLSSFSWDCTWPFSLTSANLISALVHPAHSDAIHFQSSPEPRWRGTTCFTSRTMSLINLFPV